MRTALTQILSACAVAVAWPSGIEAASAAANRDGVFDSGWGFLRADAPGR